MKATTTIKQVLTYQADHGSWFAANQALFNQVTAFYFEVIQAHEKILDLSNKDALTALEKLTHTTKSNPTAVMPLSAIGDDIPAMFRRAAIHVALGSARSFYSQLAKWRKRKEKAEAKGKKFQERPPVPPCTWNTSATLYAGMWKQRADSSIVLKIWTGTCWSWIKVRITGRKPPTDAQMGSPQLVRHGNQWWLHTPIEKHFKSPGTIEKQVRANPRTKLCAVDLNRKKQLGRIARNRRKTGVIAEGQQDNAALWNTIRHGDEQVAHLVSARIVQFAKRHEATILVFEHLGNLQPAQGKYSKRGNEKRAYWMKGRIFTYARYKAYNAGILTSRVNPRNTSRECACCHSLVARYNTGQPAEGYTPGAPLAFCPQCGMKGNSDRNASLVIGQRLVMRYQKFQEKPQTLRRGEQSPGVVVSQDAQSAEKDHLSFKQGMETATSMAPLRRERSGWMSVS